MKNITKRKAEQALRVVKARHSDPLFGNAWSNEDNAPKLVENWDWCGVKKWAIVWESGPFQWSLSAAWAVEEQVEGVFAEPVNSWSLALFPTN